MCGSNAVESVASVVGLILPSLDGAVCSGSKARAVTGAVGSISGVSRSRGPKLGVLERW